MEEKEKQEKLPLDAKLLSDAVIELNLSRRSVGLYPPEHPITRQSIERAYTFLKKLFEFRSSITLGVAKDVLMIDEYTLDRKNPIFREFALALHTKGIAAVTFYSGLEEKELLVLHGLISDKDSPAGQALVELAQNKDLRHIRLAPIDISKLRFVEGVLKEAKDSGYTLWEDYVYGLLEGKLADEDAEGVVFNIPPEDVAHILSSHVSETKEESYDKVITAYLRKKGRQGLNRESLSRFMTLVENLGPEIKKQFLSMAFKHPTLNEQKEAEELLRELTKEDVERIMNIFQEHSSMPESLRNLINKLAEVKKTEGVEEVLYRGSAHLEDIELNEEMIKLFEEDRFTEFVSEQYQRELEKMLKAKEANQSSLVEEIHKALGPEALDSTFSDVILELIDFDYITREDYLRLLTKLSELTNVFLETGRFEEVLQIHNMIYSYMLAGKFRTEALSMMEDFFHSEQFISKLLEAVNIWGRYQREATLRLAKVLRLYLINPLLDALNEEERSSQRKFYLSILSHMGKDVLPETVRRLDNERWYVVRNMIYLIRECNGREYIKKIRAFIRHKNKKVCFEALKTLLHFGTPDAFSHLKLFLRGKDTELKEQAIRLSGAYKIKEAVPYLLEILEKRDLLGMELHYKLSAVKALGKIEDPKALDTLKRLYILKPLLYQSGLEELKSEIIRSLKNYPLEQARPILELALALRNNEETRTLAQKLLSRSRDA